MKNLLFVFLVLLWSCSGLELITEEQRNVEFIESQNIGKDIAFDKALEWIAINFNSANDVIQLKDKETGILVVQAVFSYPYDILGSITETVGYTMTIRLKEDKIKFEFKTKNLLTGFPPQKGDLQKINNNYLTIKNEILTALNKEDTDF
jgi:hypothetical protein